eukprot:8557085-Lingulodinium_polyedra.AAC.1
MMTTTTLHYVVHVLHQGLSQPCGRRSTARHEELHGVAQGPEELEAAVERVAVPRTPRGPLPPEGACALAALSA